MVVLRGHEHEPVVEDLLVDLAIDSAPGQPPTVTLAGPTYAPEELAGRKVVALFDRPRGSAM